MTLVLVVGAVLLLVVLFKTGVLRGDIDRTPADVAKYIEEFVASSGGDRDWDDFTSIQIRDRRLDELRIRCSAIPDNHPPEHDGERCSVTGREALMAIVAELDLDANPVGGVRNLIAEETLHRLGRMLRQLAESTPTAKAELPDWYERAQEFQNFISANADQIDALPHFVHHYLADADIRARDEIYRVEQQSTILEIISALERGEVPPNAA